MTIVVWDGITLATDSAATDGANLWETEKAWYYMDGEYILSGAGPLQTILEMRAWFKGLATGLPDNEFPQAQLGPDWCHFLVVDKHGLRRYEQGVNPIYHEHYKCAFGEGKDFAYGAMAMGADAGTAVQIAIDHSTSCGMEVKTYRLGD